MGLFSGSKKTYVSSVSYNLAGEEAQRMNYLKTIVVGGVFSPNTSSLGESINGSYLGGPGIGLRNFARWGRTSGYNTAIGMSGSDLVSNPSLNYASIESQLSAIKGQSVVLQTAEIGPADYTFWADQFMFANFYDQMNSAWKVDFDEGANKVIITLAGGSVHQFTPAGFDKTARYLYTSFTPVSGESVGDRVEGTTFDVPPGGSFPSTVGWVLTFNDTVNPTNDLLSFVHEEISYSDGRPGETNDYTTTRSESYTAFNRIYEKTVYKGIKPGTNSTWSERQYMVFSQGINIVNVVYGPTYSESVIAGGVIRGVFTTITRQEYELVRTYRIDTREIINKTWQRPEVFIYKQNTGRPVFDAMFVPSTDKGGFLPFIPFRIDNTFLSSAYLPDVYAKSKRALKHAISADYDDLIKSISDNPSLKDIDYAYVVFGVALNVKDKHCKRYIYEFLLDNMYGGATGSDYISWRNQWRAAEASQAAYQVWVSAQTDVSLPGYGTPEPLVLAYPVPKDTSIRINSYSRNVMNYDIRISWAGIDETRGTGLLRSSAKAGDIWFDTFGQEDFYQDVYVGVGDASASLEKYLARSVSHVRMNWQVTNDTWRYLDIYGFSHENMIYGGKSVIISAVDALKDTDESGFIVPIHERILKAMPLVASTQVATACCFIVFNCYTVVKQKWYQSGLFRVFIVIIVAVVSVMFPPFGGPASTGLLGSSAAVGATLGFTGTAALIAGAIANAIAAMILTQLVMAVSVKLLGEKIGALIGAIAGWIAVQVGTAINSGMTASSIFTDMMRADNLLKLTDVFGKGVTQYLQANAMSISNQTQQVLVDYKAQSDILTRAIEENIGFDRGVIDPMAITESASVFLESGSTFLERTLMTGSDVAELSNKMITNFVDLTVNQNLAI